VNQIGAGEEPEVMDIRTTSTFTNEMLCAGELKYRAAEGKQNAKWGTAILDYMTDVAATDAKKFTGMSPNDLHALAVLARTGLQLDGKPLLFSFCSDLNSKIDWSKLAAHENKDATTLRNSHANALARGLRDYLQAKEKMTGVQVFPVEGDLPTLGIVSILSFTLIRDGASMFEFQEKGFGPAEVLHGTVDQDSTVQLTLRSPGFCGHFLPGCDAFIREYISISIETRDNKNNEIKKDIELEAKGGLWTLKAALSDYLDREIDFVVYYHNDGKVFELMRRRSLVKNLGLVMSFPVISEVVSLVSRSLGNRVDPKDDGFKSSIPISFAFGLRPGAEGQHLAITAPFMIGYNPQSAPDLAHYVRVFPHVSLVSPLADSTTKTPEVTFGAGVALVDAFAISWGLSLSGQQYLLLGISIPDLAKIVH
jgi:hypothetical protein